MRMHTNKDRERKPENTLKYPNFTSAHSEGHPHTEGTFTGTLVNVGDLRRSSGKCQGGSREHRVMGSPKFAKLHRLRQSSHEGARMLAHPENNLTLPLFLTFNKYFPVPFVGIPLHPSKEKADPPHEVTQLGSQS